MAALARADGASAAGLLLRGAAAWCAGDVRRAEAALRDALSAASAAERPYAADTLAALLVACGRFSRAAALLADPWPHAELEAGRVALLAVVHAATGATSLAARDAHDARAAIGGARADDALRVRLAQRLAHAAYFRDDAGDALAEVDAGLRAARSAGASRAAAALHAVAYAALRRLRGDAEGAWRHALLLQRAAFEGGDAVLQALAREAVCELAAER
ncbi:MAG TPA: hypothetical protein VHT53_11515, partial [Candidatus Elarobacter sp.]|nr:hypothetical protein [Candidatus Elarobacter sp.]